MLERKKDYHAWLYMAIPLILLIIFTFYPIIKTVLISFDKSYDASIDRMYFDLSLYNFQRLFQHPSFMNDGCWNNLWKLYKPKFI